MKKGFTLIELLAVIVILAIIALIATPIVLNIINESKESANLRSAEMYVGVVETSIATSTLNNKKVGNGTYGINDGNICLEYSENKCINELKVEVKGETPNSGVIDIYDGKIYKIELIYNNKVITKNNEGNLVYINPICTLLSDEDNSNTITIGDKYQCKVKETMEEEYENGYTFYVLSINYDKTINLILDRNIYYDDSNDVGFLANETNKGLVAWNSSELNTEGPITAMNYLYNATKGWDNIPNISIDYNDTINNTGDYGYGKALTAGTKTQIIKKDGTTTTVYENLKARLPYKSEVSLSGIGKWIYSNLDSDGGIIDYGNIKGIYGYWTLSSYSVYYYYGWLINYGGNVGVSNVKTDNNYGVRPVITLSNAYFED